MEENILIVHGGGPTAVINGSLYGAVTEARKYPQLQHIYAARNGTGGLLREELIDLTNVEEASFTDSGKCHRHIKRPIGKAGR